MDLLFQTICRTGIFMICAQAVVHFRPQESYEKYLKLLVSVMVLIQLLLPLGGLLTGIGGEGAVKRLESFRESLEQSMEEAQRRAEETDRLLEQMTLEEVRRRMEAQAAAGEQDLAPSGDGGTGQGKVQEAGESADPERITVEVAPIEPVLGGPQ